VEKVYSATKHFPKQESYGLTNQMQRCVISIPSNIAEGHGRRSENEFRRFLFISLGSLAELDTQLEIAKRLGYIDLGEIDILDQMIEQIRKMLCGLVKSLSTG
jgi:four helix bundle protein